MISVAAMLVWVCVDDAEEIEDEREEGGFRGS
jgi:hypothetical protein